MTKRQAGRWGNTQENTWVIIALDRYFQGKEINESSHL